MKSYIDTKSKIIRDKLEQIVINQNKEIIKINNKNIYLKFLKAKLLEECIEVCEAINSDSLKEEICDVLSVINSFKVFFNISENELEKIFNKKVKERGIISNLVLLQDPNKDKILKFILESKEQDKNILYEKSKEKIKTLIKSKEEYEELISFAISLIDY